MNVYDSYWLVWDLIGTKRSFSEMNEWMSEWMRREYGEQKEKK